MIIRNSVGIMWICPFSTLSVAEALWFLRIQDKFKHILSWTSHPRPPNRNGNITVNDNKIVIRTERLKIVWSWLVSKTSAIMLQLCADKTNFSLGTAFNELCCSFKCCLHNLTAKHSVLDYFPVSGKSKNKLLGVGALWQPVSKQPSVLLHTAR